MYTTTLAGTRHTFADLRALLAAASPARSGDVLAGIAARSMEERVAARYVLVYYKQFIIQRLYRSHY